MPLSPPDRRKDIHTRAVTCSGHSRADGMWDIEGHLVDTKTYAFENRSRGTVEPGMPVHEMWLRLTIDDDFCIKEVEAVTDHGPFRPCAQANTNFHRLVGLTIGPGWMRKVRSRLGGPDGCTHMVELLGPMATTAFQTIWPLRESRRQTPKQAADKKPALLDSCYAMRRDGEVARQLWPAYFENADGDGDTT